MEKLSKAKFKWISSLQHKKYREKYGYFVCEGEKQYKELLKNSDWQVHSIVATANWIEDNLDDMSPNIVSKVICAEVSDLNKISSLSTPQDPLMVLKLPAQNNSMIISDQNLLFYIDDLQDPGNLGTILRTADWFGHKDIILSPNTVDWTNPKVIKSSMGSFLRVAIHIRDFIQLLNDPQLKDIHIFGADMNGTSLDHIKEKDQTMIIIGNEGKGLSEIVKKRVSNLLSIPGSGKAESLNAAIAVSIFAYQFYIKNKSH
jgi:RNA methyltransferase, TrmH family